MAAAALQEADIFPEGVPNLLLAAVDVMAKADRGEYIVICENVVTSEQGIYIRIILSYYSTVPYPVHKSFCFVVSIPFWKLN